jgi:hypothetical protein
LDGSHGPEEGSSQQIGVERIGRSVDVVAGGVQVSAVTQFPH